MHRTIALCCAFAVAFLCAMTATAAAGTVSKSGTTLTYDAPDGETNVVTLTESGANYVFTDTAGVTPGEGCADDAGADPNVAVCALAGVFTIQLVLRDLPDQVTITGLRNVHVDVYGGEGADTLRSSTGTSSTAIYGGPGTDTYIGGAGGGFDYISYLDKLGPLTVSMDNVANDPDGENVPTTFVGVIGGGGNDTVIGSDDGDYVGGGGGNDIVNGLAGNDNLNGDAGDDTLNAAAGNDQLSGATGNDVLNGETGNDTLFASAGNDVFNGHDGIDTASMYSSVYATGAATDVVVTLDDVANDGQAGQSINVRTDIEDLNLASPSPGRATFTGDGDVTIINGGPANDVLDGAGGGDIVRGLSGDDTINARDNIADRIECGLGNDTANVDQHDQVLDCENVNRVTITPPPPPQNPPVTPVVEDKPPTATFVTPGEDTLIPTLRPATITVAAADDRGVSRVALVDDGRVVGTDTTAPYEFSYQPAGDDVGGNTLVAVAFDAADQTGTAVRRVRVDRFLPAVRGAVVPARDRTAPYRFRVTGGVILPRAVTAAQACTEGIVSVQVKRGARTISSRRVEIKRDCGFSSTVTFRDRRRIGNGRLNITVRFLGNDVLAPRSAVPVSVRAG